MVDNCTMPDKTTTAGKIANKLNWRIVLALSVPLAGAIVGAAVYGCDLGIGVSGFALTCEEK